MYQLTIFSLGLQISLPFLNEPRCCLPSKIEPDDLQHVLLWKYTWVCFFLEDTALPNSFTATARWDSAS